MPKLKPKKNLLDLIKSIAPEEELAKNVEAAYKSRKKFKFKRVEF